MWSGVGVLALRDPIRAFFVSPPKFSLLHVPVLTSLLCNIFQDSRDFTWWRWSLARNSTVFLGLPEAAPTAGVGVLFHERRRAAAQAAFFFLAQALDVLNRVL